MTGLSGTKVLLVEDESLIAMMIVNSLEAFGCKIVSSSPRVAHAREVAAAAEIDIAVLDVNVAGQPVFPVAEVLLERRIPFVFSTAYGADSLPSQFARYPILSKPFTERELETMLISTLQAQK